MFTYALIISFTIGAHSYIFDINNYHTLEACQYAGDRARTYVVVDDAAKSLSYWCDFRILT